MIDDRSYPLHPDLPPADVRVPIPARAERVDRIVQMDEVQSIEADL